MKPTPPGWPQISSALYYDDAAAAIRWLCDAFGFDVRIKIEGEGGRIEHSELTFGTGVVMVAQAGAARAPFWRSPASLDGANTQTLFAYVDDVDAHFARAKAAGAKVMREPTDVDYGAEYWSDRGYECVDPGGHHWYFAQRLR
ncbi:MAG TPA: VOC family protein [Polyangia bacterium]|nr:VOC family protein [Polyangia bacterium]